jgi:hypothetical protein
MIRAALTSELHEAGYRSVTLRNGEDPEREGVLSSRPDLVMDLLPSPGLALISGLAAIAFSRCYHNAGWAKALSGIMLFESGFVGVLGPMQQAAERSAAAFAGKADPTTLAASLAAERNTLWILLAVATFNVAFGIWRPHLTRLPD